MYRSYAFRKHAHAAWAWHPEFHGIALRATGLAMVAILLSGEVFAQNGDDASMGAWALEEVKLLNGESYQGLIDTQGVTGIELTEVRRPPGKPMHLVVRQIERKDILSWRRLDEPEREKLKQRIAGFKNHALIESRRRDDLRL